MITTKRELDDLVDRIQKINLKVSNFMPGKFQDKGSLEAVISKACYFHNVYDYIINFFISCHNIHPFFDGNKRTFQQIFCSLISENTNLFVTELINLSYMQILYLEKEIDEQMFKMLVEQLLCEY